MDEIKKCIYCATSWQEFYDCKVKTKRKECENCKVTFEKYGIHKMIADERLERKKKNKLKK